MESGELRVTPLFGLLVDPSCGPFIKMGSIALCECLVTGLTEVATVTHERKECVQNYLHVSKVWTQIKHTSY